jgi:uncharacterized membrane protein/protein-disulfide isomerase
MSRRAAWLAFVFSLTGLASSVVAAFTHYRMLSDPTYVSFCDVSASVSCTAVYASRFGSVAGVPVALFGAIWFACATLLSVTGLAGPDRVRENVPGYLFAGSTLALAAVLYLAYASFAVLKTACPVCLTTYAAVIGLFVVSGAATSFPMTSLPRRAVSDLVSLVRSPLAVILTLVLLAASGSALAFFPREAAVDNTTASPAPVQVSALEQSELDRYMATTQRVPLVIPTGGAAVLIVKFNDYQCPACGQSYLSYKPILAKYEASHPGAVRVVTKDFPLSRDCNPASTTNLHPAACHAAVAVRLARQQNRAEAMEEWLFKNQKGMTPQSVRQAAKEIGNVGDFDAKYASTLEQVKADALMGQQLRVSSTPTFFINGVKVDGAWAPQFFDQAIAYELKRVQSK